MFCSNCGSKLPDVAKFCGNCGAARLDTTTQVATSTSMVASSPTVEIPQRELAAEQADPQPPTSTAPEGSSGSPFASRLVSSPPTEPGPLPTTAPKIAEAPAEPPPSLGDDAPTWAQSQPSPGGVPSPGATDGRKDEWPSVTWAGGAVNPMPTPPSQPVEPLPRPIAVPGVGGTQPISEQRKKRLDRAGMYYLMAELPALLVTAGIVIGLAYLLWNFVNPVLGVLLVVAWLGSGALFLTKASEAGFARVLLGVRPPTLSERQHFEGTWNAVCHRAGVAPERYLLYVEDSDEINASAAAGHVVTTTRMAMTLPGDQFAAVIAHELGHHLGGHSLVSLLALWYGYPAKVIFAAISRWLDENLLIKISLIATALILAFFFPPILLIVFGGPIAAWASRQAELAADRTAAELGYAQPLLALFQRWQAEGLDDWYASAGWRERLSASHPTAAKRADALQVYMATMG